MYRVNPINVNPKFINTFNFLVTPMRYDTEKLLFSVFLSHIKVTFDIK